MKKLIKIGLILCLLMAATVVPAYAAIGTGGEISPMALYYSTAKATLTISSTGTASLTGKITGYEGTTTKTTVHLNLQKYENDNWIDVDDWILSTDTASTTLSKTKSSLPHGKYRAKASCYAYSGSDYERVIKYSSEVTY